MYPRDIQSGRFYVNESRGLVREVTTARNDGYVEYLSYWLSHGRSDGILKICQIHTLARWANREATDDEVFRLNRSEARTRSDKAEEELRAQLAEAMTSSQASDTIDSHFPDGFSIRDEANALVAWAFRNGPIEDLHAGKHSELLNDPALSRITDEEMKTLMVSACRQLAKLLELKSTDPAEYQRQIKSYNWRYCRNWER